MEEKSEVITIEVARRLTLALSVLAVVIPFVTSNQLITGTIVNAGLFLAGRYFSPKHYWPVVVLPSLSVMARGIIFGPLTPFLYYFIPFIWVGNYFLVRIFRKTNSVIVSSVVKAGILYIGANVFYIYKIAPEMFLTSMGVMQLLTAIFGGMVAWTVIKKMKT